MSCGVAGCCVHGAHPGVPGAGGEAQDPQPRRSRVLLSQGGPTLYDRFLPTPY